MIPQFFVRHTISGKLLLRDPHMRYDLGKWVPEGGTSSTTYRDAIQLKNKLAPQSKAVIVDQLGDIWTPARARDRGL